MAVNYKGLYRYQHSNHIVKLLNLTFGNQARKKRGESTLQNALSQKPTEEEKSGTFNTLPCSEFTFTVNVPHMQISIQVRFSFEQF